MTYAPTQVSTVSPAFRTTAAQKLARALAFVREKGEGVLGSIVISESAKAEFEEEDEKYRLSWRMGGELMIDNWTVRREVSKDVFAIFRFAWIVAPGEAMTAVAQWEEKARLRWLYLVDDDYRDHASHVASFEPAYRYMAARVGPEDLFSFSRGLVDMYDDFIYKKSINDDYGILPRILGRWSDSRLKLSFVFGYLEAFCHPPNYVWSRDPRDLRTKAMIDEEVDIICEDRSLKDAEGFRKAYDEMLSTVVDEFEDVPRDPNRPGEPLWLPLYGLEYGRRVAMGEI